MIAPVAPLHAIHALQLRGVAELESLGGESGYSPV